MVLKLHIITSTTRNRTHSSAPQYLRTLLPSFELVVADLSFNTALIPPTLGSSSTHATFQGHSTPPFNSHLSITPAKCLHPFPRRASVKPCAVYSILVFLVHLSQPTCAIQVWLVGARPHARCCDQLGNTVYFPAAGVDAANPAITVRKIQGHDVRLRAPRLRLPRDSANPMCRVPLHPRTQAPAPRSGTRGAPVALRGLAGRRARHRLAVSGRAAVAELGAVVYGSISAALPLSKPDARALAQGGLDVDIDVQLLHATPPPDAEQQHAEREREGSGSHECDAGDEPCGGRWRWRWLPIACNELPRRRLRDVHSAQTLREIYEHAGELPTDGTEQQLVLVRRKRRVRTAKSCAECGGRVYILAHISTLLTSILLRNLLIDAYVPSSPPARSLDVFISAIADLEAVLEHIYVHYADSAWDLLVEQLLPGLDPSTGLGESLWPTLDGRARTHTA
ncbi:hypothetical protein GGX14DRAFT_553556 [Mycena pura]|uniref:Uncharacterized protein n=1 Tax=Mycena pura TaxID=153505 RepID=A0AAD6YUJ4_9AGAR|nr:hypothetical protein GGX14DRAFT_553556 [Mycena pura]